MEKARKNLNKRSDFDPLLLFSFFDKYEIKTFENYDTNLGTKEIYESKLYLDIKKLKSSFKKLGVQMTSTRLKKFFQRYNSYNNGKLILHEFLDIFIPRELDPKYFKPASESRVQKVKELQQIDHFITLKTIFQIRDFIFLHIKIDKIIETILKEIEEIPSFQILSDLKNSKVNLEEEITVKGIFEMLSMDNPRVTKTEVSLMVNRFNSIVKEEIAYIYFVGNRGQ